MPNSRSNFVDIFPCSGQAMNQNHSSAPTARYNRDEKPVTYTLKLQSFSLLNKAVTSLETCRFESHIFNAGGYKWKLALYPNGDAKRNGSGHISLYLVMVDDAIISTLLEVKAVFTFLVYDHVKAKYLTIEDGKIRRFSAIQTEWGIHKLFPLKTFKDPSNGFLVNDFCVFGIDICVMKCDDGKGEVFSLINQPKDYDYIWKVNNFSQLDKYFYESNPFILGNYTWKIWLYPKGDSFAKPDFLSVYFVLDKIDELPQDFRVYVEYEMAILNQLGVGEGEMTTSHYWFESGASSWGYPNFMSLTKLKDATKGFLCKDTVNIEVNINVISTFKKIE